MAKAKRASRRSGIKAGKGDVDLKDIGKGDVDLKDIGKGDVDLKDIGKGDVDLKDIGKGGLTPAAVGSLFASLGSVNGWLIVSFLAPVHGGAAASGFGSGETVDFEGLRTITKDRDRADAKKLTDLETQVATLKEQGQAVIALRDAYNSLRATKRPRK
jgi:hypothetical protein